MEGLCEYLQNLYGKVVPLLCESFVIPRPAIGELMKHIVVRHDIVHRGGKTKDGGGVVITVGKLSQLRTDVVGFIDGQVDKF